VEDEDDDGDDGDEGAPVLRLPAMGEIWEATKEFKVREGVDNTSSEIDRLESGVQMMVLAMGEPADIDGRLRLQIMTANGVTGWISNKSVKGSQIIEFVEAKGLGEQEKWKAAAKKRGREEAEAARARAVDEGGG